MEEIIAETCRNFEKYDEHVVRENPNLELEDGECPGFNYIISSNHQCPLNCKYHEEIVWGED